MNGTVQKVSLCTHTYTHSKPPPLAQTSDIALSKVCLRPIQGIHSIAPACIMSGYDVHVAAVAVAAAHGPLISSLPLRRTCGHVSLPAEALSESVRQTTRIVRRRGDA